MTNNRGPEPTPKNPRQRAWLATNERQFPTFGRMQAFEGAACATWPVRWWQAGRYRGPWNRMTATT
ncbi:hypothetical protein SAMN05444365_104199 [Micromonospora pattaloongensis]|uniref:Uncharacterized protein n=1 Tax=Micromonospora pattaloongensis TaxID=405436 RepID=A0A1H3NWC8_9ACTN|nr:hypothetical protein [Micromonospora pattaloongensis]SDY93207.1 hypothetical protein SAMN05444365_104199 [Micromonospora pattaloongensis]